MKKFCPSKEIVDAALRVFQGMAAVDVIRPVVHQYESMILAEGQWHVRPEFCVRGRKDEVILDPKHSYLMSEADFAEFEAQRRIAMRNSRLYYEHEEQCPLLVAEHELIKAKHHLVDVMEGVTGISKDMLLSDMDKYQQYIELTLQLLGPYVAERRAQDAERESRFIRCEESSIQLLTGLGAQLGAYDREKRGVETWVTQSILKEIEKFPADFEVQQHDSLDASVALLISSYGPPKNSDSALEP